jgi:DNA-binding transcriptional ArsR family regulator
MTLWGCPRANRCQNAEPGIVRNLPKCSPTKVPRVDIDFAPVARSLASPARSAMIARLLDGRAMTAGELARAAGILPPAASEHLAQLAAAGLVVMTAEGRRRYFRIANATTAEALEALAHICPRKPARSLTASIEDAAQSNARMCYDHLAGKLGVDILDALLDLCWLLPATPGLDVTQKGSAGFRNMGIDTDALKGQRRALTRSCLDWTERRPHLAGALGASIATACLDHQWIQRRPRQRGLDITPAGSSALSDLLDIQVGVVRRTTEEPAGKAAFS